jgi:hypothetical protein
MTREKSGICGRSMLPQSQNAAQTLLFRHITPRKRFDSADFAMGMDYMGTAGSVVNAKMNPEYADLNEKKEPVKLAESLLILHRKNRQRFDSADFAMENYSIKDTSRIPPGGTVPARDKQPFNIATNMVNCHIDHRQQLELADNDMENSNIAHLMKPASASIALKSFSKSDKPLNVAKALLKRNVDHRQRFDSADYAMEHRIHSESESEKAEDNKPLPVSTREAVSQPFCETTSALSEGNITGICDGYDEIRPQQVRRIRLQRFDSADWMLQQYVKSSTELNANSDESVTNSTRGVQNTSDRNRTQQAVAKLLLERHAYKTCHFMNTPVCKHFAKQA